MVCTLTAQLSLSAAVAVGLFTEFVEFTDAAIVLTDIRERRFLAPVLVDDVLTAIFHEWCGILCQRAGAALGNGQEVSRQAATVRNRS